MKASGRLSLPLIMVLAAASAAMSAEITMHEDGGLLFMNCSFDGVVATCLWDSGSNASTAPDVAPLNGYPIDRLEGRRKLIRLRSVRFDTLEFGPLLIEKEESGFPSLGMDRFAGRRLTMTAFPVPRLILDEPMALGSEALPLSLDRFDRYVIDIVIGTRRVKALWDTGTADTRISEAVVREASPGDLEQLGEYRARHDSGGRYRLRRMELAGVEFSFPEVLSLREWDLEGIDVILGWDWIQRFDWRFDPEHRAWSARPALAQRAN